MTPTPYGPAADSPDLQYGAVPYAVTARRQQPVPLTAPRGDGARTALRVVVAVALVATSWTVAAGVAFWAVITYTGCFLGCTPGSEQQGPGLLGGAAAVVLLLAGPAIAALMWRRTRTGPLSGWALLALPVPAWAALQLLPSVLHGL